MVYDYIIEPWMAALENMYHSLIAETLWHINTQGRQGYINNFNKIISRFRRMHFRNQVGATAPRVVFNLRVLCNRYFDTRPLVVGKPDCLLPVQPRVDVGTTVGPARAAPA